MTLLGVTTGMNTVPEGLPACCYMASSRCDVLGPQEPPKFSRQVTHGLKGSRHEYIG